jgi:hypothetical protein
MRSSAALVVRSLAAAIALVAWSATANAQWLHHPAPGIPRTAEGKPDLTAPAPRTADGRPDLSGHWQKRLTLVDRKPEDTLSWAESLFRERQDRYAKDSPFVNCLPPGPIAITGVFPLKIVQTPTLIVMLRDDLTYRQIFTDGRELPHDPNPSWMGYSVGHWENDTLVVESSGFTERSWLDAAGYPHSEDLRITERYRRVDFGRIDMSATVNDPKAYARPWSISGSLELDPDTELLEYVCNENEKSRAHMVGRRSDVAAPQAVDEAVLEKYVGVYELTRPNGTRRRIDITRAGATLSVQAEGAPKFPLVALSLTRFSGPAEYEFVTNSSGEVTHFTVRSVEGENKAIRRR